jgi:hypothetical protein
MQQRMAAAPVIFASLLSLACNSVASDWEKAKRENTKASYETFIAKHTAQGKFVAQAKSAIEEIAWQQAVKTNTPDAYVSYRAAYPKGAHVGGLADRLALIAWEEVQRTPSIAAMQSFRAKYAGTKYEAAATAAIEKIVFAKSPGKRGVVELEEMAIREIRAARKQGLPIARLKLEAFEVDPRAPGPARFTTHMQNGSQVLSMDFPKDGILMSYDNPASAPAVFGDGSVHRFKGTVEAGKGDVLQFIGEDDPLHLLTFAAVKDVGYVYLRGRGQVKFRNGSSVSLGR